MPPYDSMTSFLGLDGSSHSVDFLRQRSSSPKSVCDHLPPISDSSDNISWSSTSSQLKKAYDCMEISLTAFFDFLAINGVPLDDIDKLRQGEFMREQKYVELMKQLEKYTIGSMTTSSEDEGADPGAAEAAFFLLLNAWKTVVEYTHVQHQEAYRAFHRGKLQRSQQKSSQEQQLQKNEQQEQEQEQKHSKATRRLSLPESLAYFRQGGASLTKPDEQPKQQRRFSMVQALPNVQPVTLVELTKLAEQSCACQTGYILAKKLSAKKIQQAQ